MSFTNLNRIVLSALVKSSPQINATRLYARWAHRNPAKVILPFEPTEKPILKKEKIINLDNAIYNRDESINLTETQARATIPEKDKSKNVAPVTKAKGKEIQSKKDEKLKKRMFYLSQKKVFDDNNELIYEKLKDNDGRISALLTNIKSKKDRLRTSQVMVEGWRMIVDGLEAKCKLNYLIFSRTEDLNNLRPFLPKTGVKLYRIPYKEINLWSDVETPPGVFGIFQMPTPQNIRKITKSLPIQLVCDNIRVPGNLGAILRVAVGAGCEKVLLTKGCVDVWDPKVLRSGAGAHFRLPIHPSIEWEDMPNHLEENTSVFVADSNAKVLEDDEMVAEYQNMQIPVLPYYSVQYSSLKHVTLIVGGETEGISEDSYRLTAVKNGVRLNIPMQKGVDSLNTGMAAAVIAFEIRKQMIQASAKEKMEKRSAELL